MREPADPGRHHGTWTASRTPTSSRVGRWPVHGRRPGRARHVRARRGHHRPERQHRQLRRHQRRLTDPDNVRRSVSCGEAPHEALRAARHSDGIVSWGAGSRPGYGRPAVTSSIESVRAPSGRELLRDRRVTSFLLAATAQTVATTMQAAALGKQVFDITDSTLDLGLLGLFEFLPALVLVPLTGSAADRFDRRRVASIAMAARGAHVDPVRGVRGDEPHVGDARSSPSRWCSGRPGRSPRRRSGRCRRWSRRSAGCRG